MTPRKFVTVPDGRRWPGRWPQSMPATGEGPFIAALAATLGGACEVALPVGRADVATGDTVFEVEPVKSWRKGVRQVLAYAGQTGQQPAVALFGPADYVPIYLFLRDRLPAVRLWVWRCRWKPVTSRTTASGAHYTRYDIPPVVGEAHTEGEAAPIPARLARYEALVPAHTTDPAERAKCRDRLLRADMARRGSESAAKRRSAA